MPIVFTCTIYIHVNLSSLSSFILFPKHSSHRRRSRKLGRRLRASMPSKFVTSPTQALTAFISVDPRPIELLQRCQSKRNNTPFIHHRNRLLPFQYSMWCPPLEYKTDSYWWPLHTGPSPTMNHNSPQLTH
jgi:hypothetical protein